MLIQCSECELQVSDKALACPHCGFPMKPDVQRAPRKSNRRKRLPNGFGQITELKGRNLRKPFRAMVTVGKTPEGRFIQKPLKPESHFETYNAAYSALVEYHKSPYDESADLLMSELYTRWSEEHFKKLKSEDTIRSIGAAWAYCSPLYNLRVADVRTRHLKKCLENSFVIVKGETRISSANTKARIKSIFNAMFDYAVEYEIINKNYARDFTLPAEIVAEQEKNAQGHKTFKGDEIDLLWKNVEVIPYVDIVLIHCYSGWRPQELGLIELSNVNIDEWTFTGGMKTDAGANRVVPIHSKIRPLVKRRYDEATSIGSKYLFNVVDSVNCRSGIALTYEKYKRRFTAIVNKLGLESDHRPHDPRKHFVTMAKKYNVDEYAIKYIVGHVIDDITERVYTERDVEWLKSEIEKIK